MPETRITRGYAHPDYTAALSEFGNPRALSQSGGCILEREIPGTDARDAMGSYPIFSCRDWSRLNDDLNSISKELVSLVLVADPFGGCSEEMLRRTFSDLVAPFKEHFVADLRHSASSFVSKHHKYYARKALATVKVEVCEDPSGKVDEWSELYDHVITRHQLKGIKAFSRASFVKQLKVPGLIMLRATHEGEPIGAHLWYLRGNVAYSHLVASNVAGYKLMSAYALAWRAIEYFTGKVQWIDWGAGAGLNTKSADGLTRYKRGWANDTRMAYLCGRIFDLAKYDEISQDKGLAGSPYFPRYRAGELG
jgi:hypothetical protein